MRIGAAFRGGLRRVNGAPAVVAGLFALTLLVAGPLSLGMRSMIAAHLGSSQAADALAAGTSTDWWEEFSAQASGLGRTFVPSITGFGAVLENVQGVVDNLPLASTLAGVTAGWLILWSFLSGGVLDRLARGRRTGSHGFFAACGMHGWRMARLGLLAWAAYAVLFGYVHGWIFTSALGRLTRNVSVERTAFAWRLVAYAVFALPLVACNMAFDYARVRLVVEDRRSAIGALLAGVRFVRRHAARAVGLYALNAVAFLLLAALYAWGAPGAPRGTLSTLLVVGAGEAWIVGRLYLKLVSYASAIALFQGELAHAAYTAAPAVVWPDSPAAESLANADHPALP